MQWRKKQQRAYDPEKGLYKQADQINNLKPM